MKNTHCCQCGEVRPLVVSPTRAFLYNEILHASSVRQITRQPFNEADPQMIITAQVYRNGGSSNETHICGLCLVEALKVIRNEIDAVVQSAERKPPTPTGKDSA